jgi:hypothetical protein
MLIMRKNGHIRETALAGGAGGVLWPRPGNATAMPGAPVASASLAA